MTNNPDKAGSQFSLLHDCSHMDISVVERLRATVEVSQEWAEQVLDVIIQLDDDLQALNAMVKQRINSLRLPGSRSSEETENRIPGLEEIADQTEQSVQCLRKGVRDLMMSMQRQDVIGQAVERAASAVKKRADVLEKLVEVSDASDFHTSEIAEIHHAYRAEDDLHRATV